MMPKTQKFFIIMALAIIVVGSLPSVVEVWAEAHSNSTETDLDSRALIPSAQGEGSKMRPPASVDDMIVQFGEDAESISIQSDNSGVEVVPGAAFVHTGELNNNTQANDWFFLFADQNPAFGGGYLLNDSATNQVCLAAPVYLPEGSVINSFTAYLFDNFGPNNVTIYFDRTFVDGGWDELAQVQSINGGSIQALTDPSILNTGGANVVQSFYNYHLDFCLPAASGRYNAGFGADIRVLGAQVNYIPPSTFPSVTTVYLPVVLKIQAPTIQFSVKNETGGVLLYYTVLNTPQGTINCPANIPNGATAFCGAFNAGTYTVNVQSNGPGCGPGTGPLTFPSGSCTRMVRCGRNPSVWQCN